jgi:hypothetical protein
MNRMRDGAVSAFDKPCARAYFELLECILFANQACDQRCNVISHFFVDNAKLFAACAASYVDTRDSMQVLVEKCADFSISSRALLLTVRLRR